MRIKGRGKLTEETIDNLYQETNGWAAGLVLLADRADAAMLKSSLTVRHPGQVFDYFAREAFDNLDRETRDFLLQSSFLPRMTSYTAAKFTDNEKADKILSGLSRNHLRLSMPARRWNCCSEEGRISLRVLPLFYLHSCC